MQPRSPDTVDGNRRSLRSSVGSAYHSPYAPRKKAAGAEQASPASQPTTQPGPKGPPASEPRAEIPVEHEELTIADPELSDSIRLESGGGGQNQHGNHASQRVQPRDSSQPDLTPRTYTRQSDTVPSSKSATTAGVTKKGGGTKKRKREVSYGNGRKRSIQSSRFNETNKDNDATQPTTGLTITVATNPDKSPAKDTSENGQAAIHMNSTGNSESRNATDVSGGFKAHIPASAAQRVSLPPVATALSGGGADIDGDRRPSAQPRTSETPLPPSTASGETTLVAPSQHHGVIEFPHEANSGQPSGQEDPTVIEEAWQRLFDAMNRRKADYERQRKECENLHTQAEMHRLTRETLLRRKSELEKYLGEAVRDIQMHEAQERHVNRRYTECTQEAQHMQQSVLGDEQRCKELEQLISAFKENKSQS